jgi:hypothetical protein
MRFFYLLLTFLAVNIVTAQFVPSGYVEPEMTRLFNHWVFEPMDLSTIEKDEVNNRIWVGGSFTSIKHISYGADWMEFNRNYPKQRFPMCNGSVEKIISDGGTGYFVVGQFDGFDMVNARNKIAHFDSDFNLSNWENQNQYLASYLDDTIKEFIIGANYIYALHANRVFVMDKVTGTDLFWSVGVVNPGEEITSVQEINGKLYIGGHFQSVLKYFGDNEFVDYTEHEKNGMVEIDLATAEVTLWDAGLSPNASINAITKDGNKLFIGGDFTQILNTARNNLASCTVSGGNLSLTNWIPSVNGTVSKLKTNGNKLIVIGDFTTVEGLERNKIAYINKTNTTVNSFNPGVYLQPSTSTNLLQIDFFEGKVILQTDNENLMIGDSLRNYIAAFDTLNYILHPWNPAQNGYAKVSVANNLLFLMGSYTHMDKREVSQVMAFDATTLEPLNDQVELLPITSEIPNFFIEQMFIKNNKMYVKYMPCCTASKNYIYDLSTLETIYNDSDSTLFYRNFKSFHNEFAYFFERVGYFINPASIANNGYLKRMNSNTFEIDTSFNVVLTEPSENSNFDVSNIEIKDSMLYFVGDFTKVNGIPRNSIAAINLNTLELDSLNPEFVYIDSYYNNLNHLKIVDSILFIEGEFTSVENQPRERLAAINLNTGRLTNWNPGLSYHPTSFVFLNNRFYFYSELNQGLIEIKPIFDNQSSATLPSIIIYAGALKLTTYNNNLFVLGSELFNEDYVYFQNIILNLAKIEICETEHLDMVEIYLGESYTWHGTTYNQTGTYYLTQTNPTGCDSVYILNLNVTDKFYVEQYQTACDSFQWQQTNLTYNQSGYYRDTVYGFIDTIYTLHLTMYQSPQASFYDTIYSDETYSWYGSNYTSTGTYTTTQPSNVYCDSVLTLNLVHIPYQYDSTVINSCLNAYTWPYNNQTYYQSGVFSDTIFTSTVDTIHILQLSLASPPVNINDTLLNSFSFYDFNGQLLNQSGDYSDTLTSTNGCDSVINLSLVVYQPIFDTLNITACGSYTWNTTGQSYTISGTYQDTIITPTIDTLYVLNLTINSYPQLSISDTLESSSGTYNFNGTILSQAGIYVDTIAASVGCDTIVELTLVLRPAVQDTIAVSTCDNYTWPISGLTYTTSGLYVDTIFGVTVQDTIRVLDLTINNSSTSSVTQTACGSYTWIQNNETYTISGTYSDTIQNTSGCDSIVTLNLTIIPIQTLVVSNYTVPASTGNCDGTAQLSFTGNGDFEADIDGGAITFTSSSDYQVEGLCAGIHELIVTDACGATNTSLLIVPSSTNYIFENSFPSEEIIDTVSVTLEECVIDYNSIDTAYIESITVNGTELSVVWNVVDDNGNHLIGSTYNLENGDGAYFLQLNLYCPTKLNGSVFSVGETILFQGGSVSQASIGESVADFGINIYPNPTNDFVYLNFKSSSLIYELSDAQGRVLSKGMIANNGTISLLNFERGIYYISLNNGNKSVTKRVVKN